MRSRPGPDAIKILIVSSPVRRNAQASQQVSRLWGLWLQFSSGQRAKCGRKHFHKWSSDSRGEQVSKAPTNQKTKTNKCRDTAMRTRSKWAMRCTGETVANLRSISRNVSRSSRDTLVINDRCSIENVNVLKSVIFFKGWLDLYLLYLLSSHR